MSLRERAQAAYDRGQEQASRQAKQNHGHAQAKVVKHVRRVLELREGVVEMEEVEPPQAGGGLSSVWRVKPEGEDFTLTAAVREYRFQLNRAGQVEQVPAPPYVVLHLDDRCEGCNAEWPRDGAIISLEALAEAFGGKEPCLCQKCRQEQAEAEQQPAPAEEAPSTDEGEAAA